MNPLRQFNQNLSNFVAPDTLLYHCIHGNKIWLEWTRLKKVKLKKNKRFAICKKKILFKYFKIRLT